MENSGILNAGIGSCLTFDREIEMDAAIMSGKDISSGVIGMVKNIKNPIKIARLVMEKSDHVMLVSEGAIEFAKKFGIRLSNIEPTSTAVKKYNKFYKELGKTWNKNQNFLVSKHYGTVGAVAIDKKQNVASAVSTGGLWLKMKGRIGDSAIIGGGFYADNESGAACATGVGELIMRICLCKLTCDQMKGYDATVSCEKAIGKLTQRFGKGNGGVIAVDKNGRFGFSANTPCMPVAVKTNSTKEIRVILNKEEKLFE